MDSYPYASISAFALHPLYLNLDRFLARTTRRFGPAWPASEKAQHPAGDGLRGGHEGENGVRAENLPGAARSRDFSSADYQEFFNLNKDWLSLTRRFVSCATNSARRIFCNGPSTGFMTRRKSAPFRRDTAARDELDLHCFIQFHLHLQLREAADYLHRKGVILKGDIAIGVYPQGADVWQQPELFHTEMQAGAPPERFRGQGPKLGLSHLQLAPDETRRL